MIPSKLRIRQAFDRAASSYDGAAGLQREVATRLAGRLEEALMLLGRTPRLALDVGSGTGYGEWLLHYCLPGLPLMELDIAPGMLNFARQQRASEIWCPGVCGDVEAMPLADGSFDLIWSSLALQWAGAGERAFPELYRCLDRGGVVHFSTLGPGTLRELGQAFAGVDGYRHVNRFVESDVLAENLKAAGFEAIRVEREDIVVPYQAMREVMRDLKAIGARRVLEEGVPGLMGKNRWRLAEANYEALRRDGSLPATYDVIYLSARKPV